MNQAWDWRKRVYHVGSGWAVLVWSPMCPCSRCRADLTTMQTCCVCADASPKYRCPPCCLRYCSLQCYKKHKEECIPKADQVQGVASSQISPTFRGDESWRDGGNSCSMNDILDEDGEQDRVPPQKLKLLGESEELKNLLQNPHLRQLLLTVDQAEEKETVLKNYMQEPLFVEFADKCLQIVEPPDKENSYPE
ncbi:zinc finger HIT domain-containing protein 3 [Microcaecilia unicolor]|uniref:Zinc finger HIT domain-containing protein 3 n=1 Tax=Microcaecilia unicolor TaxID=1415580 RepID=A0A6P7WTL8_9AMPH|nr:zinc finger HIT domain-containing protein 3 [Microcaecilia unicolor]